MGRVLAGQYRHAILSSLCRLSLPGNAEAEWKKILAELAPQEPDADSGADLGFRYGSRPKFRGLRS